MMRNLSVILLVLSIGCAAPALNDAPAGVAAPLQPAAVDSVELMRDIAVLAHDSMEGRRVGTEGSARARRFIEGRFAQIGLLPVDGDFQKPFPVSGDVPVTGVNLVGMIRGGELEDRYIVVTAHYDHLGTRDGEIFNGADDNASGTAALLQIAGYFSRQRPRHSIIFAALDGEEGGLRGARAFIADPPVPQEAIVLNVNMDMVGRNDAGELYVAGTRHYPQLLPYVEAVAAAAEVTLIPGHDAPNAARPSDDWTMASDHGPFHAAGIPFLYFGVEDHPYYHQPTDEVSGIQPGFYRRAVRTVLQTVRLLDQSLTGG
ncbi:MAG: M28 family peptidase [Gemmatimonadota bacterium]